MQPVAADAVVTGESNLRVLGVVAIAALAERCVDPELDQAGIVQGDMASYKAAAAASVAVG